MKKKILCILLAVSMMCSSLVVYAEENPSEPEEALTAESPSPDLENEEPEPEATPELIEKAELSESSELTQEASAAPEWNGGDDEMNIVPDSIPTIVPEEPALPEEGASPEKSLLPSVSPGAVNEPTILPSEAFSEETVMTPSISPGVTASASPAASVASSASIMPSADITPAANIDAVYEYDFSNNQTVLIASDMTEDEIVNASEGLPQIDAPSEAHWNIIARDMVWNLSENGTGAYRLSIYREGETEAIYSIRCVLDASDTLISYNIVLAPAALDKMNTGKYYFTVYAEGNNEYSDSDVCISDILDYVRPDKKLAAPTNLTWDGFTARWNLPEGKAAVACELAYRPEGGSNFKRTAAVFPGSSTPFVDLARFMNEKGAYRFRLKALSGNIFDAVDSDWTDWSAEISTEGLTAGIATELKELIEKNAGADELLDCLDKKDTEQLAVSLQTDADVRSAIAAAEQTFAQEKGIIVESDVAADMKEKISGDISIVGAAFNAGTNVSKMTLKLTKPTVEKEVDKQQYKNVVQVNMTLDGAADTQNLKVPVRITMPIPTGVNAPDLQILHYHNDGTIETILPYISGNMASFTLTSFSTFVFANKADGALPFTDVETNKWSYAGIKFVYEKGIMTGVEETLFQPNVPLTRGMFASIIYRLAGAPGVTYKNIFSDVPAGKWYSNAIIWAYENKIVAGLGNGKYGVYDNITREQMARMLMEYAKVQGYDTSGRADFNKFADASAVSGWAAENMSWAVESGIISGSVKDGKYYMNPKGQATRAEAATMLMKFIQKYV